MHFRDPEDCEGYHRGYLLGYRAGYRDGLRETHSETEFLDIPQSPITVLGLSVRAYNCLHQAGCITVADVVSLNEHQITHMRNLGKKSAAEIACALRCCGISGSMWDLFLMD